MHEEDLVQRQPSKARRLTPWIQTNALENKSRKGEAELCEEGLITRSRSWYHGIDDKQIVELLKEAFSVYFKLADEAV